MNSARTSTLASLRGTIGRLEGEPDGLARVALGHTSADAMLQGGLVRGALHIGGGAVDAIEAVVVAGVGEQDFQERDAAAVRRVGMADAHARIGRAHTLAVAAVARLGAAGGTGGVVFGGVRQDFEFALQVHRLESHCYC